MKHLPVQNRIGVIAKDNNAFFEFMRPFSISLFSKNKNKFWINKGTTEYFLIDDSHVGVARTSLTGVIMLDGCQDKFDLYIQACRLIGTIELTEAEKERENEVNEIINISPQEVDHDESDVTQLPGTITE